MGGQRSTFTAHAETRHQLSPLLKWDSIYLVATQTRNLEVGTKLRKVELTGWHGEQWDYQNNEKTMEHSDHSVISRRKVLS